MGKRLGALLAFVVLASSAGAHHSFAVFDSTKSFSIQGTVVDFQWVNPHCWLDLMVQKSDGSSEKWGFEGPPPLMMRNQGISKDTFKAGDKVVVTAHPRKDGSNAGSIVGIVAADGTTIIAPRVRPPPAAPAVPASPSESPNGAQS